MPTSPARRRRGRTLPRSRGGANGSDPWVVNGGQRLVRALAIFVEQMTIRAAAGFSVVTQLEFPTPLSSRAKPFFRRSEGSPANRFYLKGDPSVPLVKARDLRDDPAAGKYSKLSHYGFFCKENSDSRSNREAASVARLQTASGTIGREGSSARGQVLECAQREIFSATIFAY